MLAAHGGASWWYDRGIAGVEDPDGNSASPHLILVSDLNADRWQFFGK